MHKMIKLVLVLLCFGCLVAGSFLRDPYTVIGGAQCTDSERIAVFALEGDEFFSGNGIHLKHEVQGLALQGACVLVVGGTPNIESVAAGRWIETLNVSNVAFLGLHIEQWGMLTREGGWREFVGRISGKFDALDGQEASVQHDAEHVAFVLDEFRPTVVAGVDWHGMVALLEVFSGSSSPSKLFLNYRIFSNSPGMEKSWYTSMERNVTLAADRIIVLSDADREYIKQTFLADSSEKKDIKIVYPCLRQDLRQVAVKLMQNEQKLIEHQQEIVYPDGYDAESLQNAIESGHIPPPPSREKRPIPKNLIPPKRRYLTWCNRAAVEKSPWRFIHLVALLEPVLKAAKIKPLMCLTANNTLATDLESSLLRIFPSASIRRGFQTKKSLQKIFQRTILNVHTPTYEAFGMVIVEAAAFGALTLLHAPPTEQYDDTHLHYVGATQLLRVDYAHSIGADMSLILDTPISPQDDLPEPAFTSCPTSTEGPSDPLQYVAFNLCAFGLRKPPDEEPTFLEVAGSWARSRALEYDVHALGKDLLNAIKI